MSVRQSTRSQQVMAGAHPWVGRVPGRGGVAPRSGNVRGPVHGPGLKCGGCPIKLSRALYEVAGVEDAPATNGHDPRANFYG
jgi:hypothetical protein